MGATVDDPMDRLAAYIAARDARRVLTLPRVSPGGLGRAAYFVYTCVHCDTESYHHLDTPLSAPESPGERVELGHCEECGSVTSWDVLGGLADGSVRVLGPVLAPAGLDGPET